MAIEFDFVLGTPVPAPQVARELHDIADTLGLFDTTVSPELIFEEGAKTRQGTRIRVHEANPRPHDPVTEDLGFVPTVVVAFRQDKFTDMSAQDDDMVRLVSGLLDRVPGDAVLHFQLDEIWLLRRGSELSLNEDDKVWPPRLLAAVHQPYRRVTYAFS